MLHFHQASANIGSERFRVFDPARDPNQLGDSLRLRPAVWKYQSPGAPLLINQLGRYVYGALAFDYTLDAYTVTYGAFAFDYILSGIVEAIAASSGAGAAAMVAIGEYNRIAASAGSGTSAVAVQRVSDALAASSAAGGGSVLAGLVAVVVAASTGAIGAVFSFDGEEYDVWVFNADTFAASRYFNFNFNSFAGYQGRYYGANAAGIYELAGEDDAGEDIVTSLMFGRMNFGTSQQKRMLRAYLGGTSEGKMVLRVVGDDGGIRTYRTNVALGDVVNYRRVDPARGLTAHFWQIELKNELGQDFEIDGMDVYPVILQRRIK